MAADLIYWAKYSPKSFKQMILLPRIEKMVATGIDNNMIFYGTPGTGKTSLSNLLAKQTNSLTLNGKLGIEILSSKIESHLRGLSFVMKDKVKLIFIDEFDRASITLQDGLKSFIESYPTARFIFTTNHINKITDELKSRFISVPFDPIDSSEREFIYNKQISYLKSIAKHEGSDIYTNNELFEKIVSKNFPDLRQSCNLLQVVIRTDDISIVSGSYGSTKDDLFEFIMDGDISPMHNYDYVMNNFFITFDDAFKYLSRPLFEYLKEFHIDLLLSKGGRVLKTQKEYNETLIDTLDPIVHLVNYIIDLKTGLK